ncbi:MAG: hypothetical protein KF745_15315 [Phycisphaeraceae bacterium]|nr:hypothetical protein [Phycisphaeraceae bacterium]
MHTTPRTSGRPIVHVLRWLARIGSLASIGMLAAFAFGGGEPGVPTLRELGMIALFPVGVSLGMILGWWRELWGGVLTVLSLAAFYALSFGLTGRPPGGPYFVIFALPGVLFLACGLLARGRRAG